jgi:hypothetical protein
MNEPLENIAAPSAYRFLDSNDGQANGREMSGSVSVEFYPDIDDFVHIAEVNRKTYKLPFRAQYALQAFIVVNAIGLPATLWLFNLFIAGVVIFAFNMAMALLFIPATLRTDYRRFFQSLYGNIENEIVRVELNKEGILCSHLGDTSFHRWKNVKRIEETKDSIFFFLINSRAVAVRKSGFAYDGEKNRFLGFAREQIQALLPHNATNRT